MDIETGDSPPIASKPYTLSLKYYDWVQKEISTLDRAGIITKSISPWVSPVVIVPKKSAPGEPPPRGGCVWTSEVYQILCSLCTSNMPSITVPVKFSL